MFRYAALIYFGVLVSVSGHLTEEERIKIHEKVRPFAIKCMEELGVPMEHFESMKKSPDHALNVDPCFLSCMFKSKGMINEDGMYDLDASIDFISDIVKDEKVLLSLKEMGEACTKVNKEDVTDGKKGCERASLLAQCLKENKNNLGFA